MELPQEYRQLEYLLSWHDGISRLFFILIISLSGDNLDDPVTPNLQEQINNLREFKSRFEAHLSLIEEITKNIQKTVKVEPSHENYKFFDRLYDNVFLLKKLSYFLENIYNSSDGHKKLCDELQKMISVICDEAPVILIVIGLLIVKQKKGLFTTVADEKLEDIEKLSDLISVTVNYIFEIEKIGYNIKNIGSVN